MFSQYVLTGKLHDNENYSQLVNCLMTLTPHLSTKYSIKENPNILL